MTPNPVPRSEPVTADLHDQWATSRLKAALEELSDLIGACFTATPDSAPREGS